MPFTLDIYISYVILMYLWIKSISWKQKVNLGLADILWCQDWELFIVRLRILHLSDGLYANWILLNCQWPPSGHIFIQKNFHTDNKMTFIEAGLQTEIMGIALGKNPE